MNPSDRLQRILDVLDQPTQAAGDVAYEFTDPTLCWRCEAKPPDSQAAGLCAACHETLQGDATLPPHQSPEIVRAERQLQRDVERILHATDEQMSAAVRAMGEFAETLRGSIDSGWIERVLAEGRMLMDAWTEFTITDVSGA